MVERSGIEAHGVRGREARRGVRGREEVRDGSARGVKGTEGRKASGDTITFQPRRWTSFPGVDTDRRPSQRRPRDSPSETLPLLVQPTCSPSREPGLFPRYLWGTSGLSLKTSGLRGSLDRTRPQPPTRKYM